MFLKLERAVGKTASLAIHRRILSYVPKAYTPILRAVSRAFQEAASPSPFTVPEHKPNAVCFSIMRWLIRNNDIHTLQDYFVSKCKWDVSYRYRYDGLVKYAFEIRASATIICYLVQNDVGSEPSHIVYFIVEYNRKDVLEALPLWWCSVDELVEGVSVFYDDAKVVDTWVFDWCLQRHNGDSSVLSRLWDVITTSDAEDARLVHWLITRDVPIKTDIGDLVHKFIASSGRQRTSHYDLFERLVVYWRKMNQTDRKFFYWVCTDFEEGPMLKKYIRFIRSSECLCNNPDNHN